MLSSLLSFSHCPILQHQYLASSWMLFMHNTFCLLLPPFPLCQQNMARKLGSAFIPFAGIFSIPGIQNWIDGGTPTRYRASLIRHRLLTRRQMLPSAFRSTGNWNRLLLHTGTGNRHGDRYFDAPLRPALSFPMTNISVSASEQTPLFSWRVWVECPENPMCTTFSIGHSIRTMTGRILPGGGLSCSRISSSVNWRLDHNHTLNDIRIWLSWSKPMLDLLLTRASNELHHKH